MSKSGQGFFNAEFNTTKRFVVEGNGKPERLTLTRRRGGAEFGRKKREDQNERGDSGGSKGLRTEQVGFPESGPKMRKDASRPGKELV